MDLLNADPTSHTQSTCCIHTPAHALLQFLKDAGEEEACDSVIV